MYIWTFRATYSNSTVRPRMFLISYREKIRPLRNFVLCSVWLGIKKAIRKNYNLLESCDKLVFELNASIGWYKLDGLNTGIDKSKNRLGTHLEGLWPKKKSLEKVCAS